MYGASVWRQPADTNIKKVEGMQNNPRRWITNAIWLMRNDQLRRDLEIHKIKGEIIKTTKKVIESIEQHTKPLTREAIKL